MPRVINIEIMRLKPKKKTAVFMAILALIIGCLVTSLPGAQAQYASAEQDRHVLYFDKEEIDIGVTLTENSFWNNNKDGLQFKYEDYEKGKGLIKTKSPIIVNPKDKGNCYMRVCLRIVAKNDDGTTSPLEPTTDVRAEQILSNLWYDKSGEAEEVQHYLTPNNATGRNSYSTSVSKERLQELLDEGSIDHYCNTADFEEPVYNETMKAYVFNYKGLFKKDSQTTLFNRVVYPTDMSQQDWQAVQGEYYIIVWAQAIQAVGFDDADSALSHLSDEYVPTTLPEA